MIAIAFVREIAETVEVRSSTDRPKQQLPAGGPSGTTSEPLRAREFSGANLHHCPEYSAL